MNLNDTVKARLTEFGKRCVEESYREVFGNYANKSQLAKWIKQAQEKERWQIHDLANTLGPWMRPGCQNVIEGNNMELIE